MERARRADPDGKADPSLGPGSALRRDGVRVNRPLSCRFATQTGVFLRRKLRRDIGVHNHDHPKQGGQQDAVLEGKPE